MRNAALLVDEDNKVIVAVDNGYLTTVVDPAELIRHYREDYGIPEERVVKFGGVCPVIPLPVSRK